MYAPLVGVTFDANAGDATVTNMPEAQTAVSYSGSASERDLIPVREGYEFTGWYTDAQCTQKYDFATALTANWTVLYAGWQEETEEIPDESTPSGAPSDPENSDPGSEEIADESTPLAPPTGEAPINPAWMIAAILLAGGCAAAVVLCRRRESGKNH